MDTSTLTALVSQVMVLLTPWMPYLGKAGEAVATKSGEAAFEKAAELYKAIHTRFIKEVPTDQGKASQALELLSTDPDNAETVQKKLIRILQNDPAFFDSLRNIIEGSSGPIMSAKGGKRSILEDIDISSTHDNSIQTVEGADDATLRRIRLRAGRIDN